jgi:hypothetical protein
VHFRARDVGGAVAGDSGGVGRDAARGAWTALYAPLGRLAAELGGIVHLPGAALVALSVAVAAALAWGGAELALAVRARASPSVVVHKDN